MSVISVKGLSKSFQKGLSSKQVSVLKNITFSVKEGRITGFLGANGSGKTTTMKCLLELIWPDQGECRFFGNRKLHSKLWSRIGFLPEHPYFYDFLTGEEFLLFYGRLSHSRHSAADLKSRVNMLLKKMDLYKDKNKKLRQYSKGMLQKIGLLQAVVHKPDLLILDEPMSGLDFNGRSYVMETIQQSADQGASVFLSSHLLHDVERLCSDLVVLKEGEVIFEGDMGEFMGAESEKMEIIYIDKQKADQTRTASNLEECQRVLDELRSQKLDIVSVERVSSNLEETFRKLALKQR